VLFSNKGKKQLQKWFLDCKTVSCTAKTQEITPKMDLVEDELDHDPRSPKRPSLIVVWLMVLTVVVIEMELVLSVPDTASTNRRQLNLLRSDKGITECHFDWQNMACSKGCCIQTHSRMGVEPSLCEPCHESSISALIRPKAVPLQHSNYPDEMRPARNNNEKTNPLLFHNTGVSKNYQNLDMDKSFSADGGSASDFVRLEGESRIETSQKFSQTVSLEESESDADQAVEEEDVSIGDAYTPKVYGSTDEDTVSALIESASSLPEENTTQESASFHGIPKSPEKGLTAGYDNSTEDEYFRIKKKSPENGRSNKTKSDGHRKSAHSRRSHKTGDSGDDFGNLNLKGGESHSRSGSKTASRRGKRDLGRREKKRPTLSIDALL